ncbi:adp-ribosylation factor-like protein 2 [Cystoisospora suis]|uniref:ADP-ribosylation factor-like protein 2 n=1 Tax=Cystoisospora suis TaxID=483139 RepID=A0A2C6L4K3_9APIC|nr:adp-ribosylation factor-like protein 2 [Cystoisospora suis]
MVLLKVLRKTKQKEKELRLLMLGLDNAGKTTIVKRINGQDWNTVSPTLGFSISSFEYRNYKLNIWDVGGQRTIRSFWRNYFEETDGVVWVVDSADRPRMQVCREELHKLMKEERLAGATLLIFANKQDVPSSLTAFEISKALELDKMRGSRHWNVVACSAREGAGLIDGLAWLVDDISSRVFVRS